MVTHRHIRDLAVEKGILTEKEADEMFDVRELTRNLPGAGIKRNEIAGRLVGGISPHQYLRSPTHP